MSSATTNIGIKRAVLEGRLSHTAGNLSSSDLKENKSGRVVSKKASTSAKKNYNKQGNDGPKGWNKACQMAAKELEFWPVPIKKGTKFYNLAKKYHNEMKDENI